ncbi:hypothetical protein JHN48_33480, partial [Streptomyces sp. MBT72]|nr:hypothetical protein [Streptomyces sp. MBT72]
MAGEDASAEEDLPAAGGGASAEDARAAGAFGAGPPGEGRGAAEAVEAVFREER